MSLKALVMDVDDTLYDHGAHCIPKKHIDLLAQARKKGLKVFLCTGRPMAMLKDLMDLQPGMYDGIVSGNGCAAWDENLQPLMDITLPEGVVEKAMQIARDRNCPLFCAGSQSMCVTRMSPLGRKVFDHMEVSDMPVRDPQPGERFSLVEIQPDPPITFFEEGEAMEGVRVVYFPEFTDLNPVGISKITGIHALMKHHGFEERDYIAFGDSVNDREMILDAAVGVAMGNSSPDLKALASYETTSAAQGGIADFFEAHQLLDHLEDGENWLKQQKLIRQPSNIETSPAAADLDMTAHSARNKGVLQ